MKQKSYWIWNWGDWEIFHITSANLRREERGKHYPAMWNLPLPYSTAPGFETFRVEPNPGSLETIQGIVPIMGGTLLWNGKTYPLMPNKTIQLPRNEEQI